MEAISERRKTLEDKLKEQFNLSRAECYRIHAGLSDDYIENYLLKEPNEMTFIEETTGLECYISRHPSFGHLCGYVIIPNEFKELFNSSDALDDSIEVHGGVTFLEKKETIDKYCVGFDCAHAGDLLPIFLSRNVGEVYRDMAYVKDQCISLAKQVHELIKRGTTEPEIFTSDPKELRKIIKSLREEK